MPYEERYLSTLPLIETPDRRLKSYHVNVTDREIEAAVVEAAYAYLPKLLPVADAETPAAGWVILHRGQASSYLVAYSWVWDNVVECRAAVAASAFLGCPDDDPTNFVTLDRPWMGCIWETPPFGHEREAWIRHILAPEVPDADSYLADTFPPGVIAGGAR